MSELDEIRAEVADLRRQVAEVRETATDAKTLAGMADRDAAGVRAGQRAILGPLGALRETQVEQGAALAGMATALARQGEILARHAGQMDGMVAAVSALADGQERLAAVLDEHTRLLTGHGEALAEILRRLPPPAQ